MYRSQSTVGIGKSRSLGRMRETKNAYRICVRKFLGKRSLVRPRRTLREVYCGDGRWITGSGEYPMADF